MDEVILVDSRDKEIGSMEKLAAHQQGVLHRAFSILIYNEQGDMLIHQRANGKYHSGGLWTNACCSHPKPGESAEHAVRRRLMEEMGIDAQPTFLYKFLYKISLDNALIEHEYDHVYSFQGNVSPVANTEEVADWKYISIEELTADIDENPDQYTFWFKMIMDSLHKKQLVL